MSNKITNEGLEKLKEFVNKICSLNDKANKLINKINFLIKNMKEPDTKILMKCFENINPAYVSEGMLAEYIDYAKKLEAFVDELEKCLKEHYNKYFQNTGKPPPGPPPPGGGITI